MMMMMMMPIGGKMEKNVLFKSFRTFLESTREAAAKTGNYPFSYGGLGLYPMQDNMPIRPDYLVYMKNDKRFYFHNGEGPPWDITHLKGNVEPWDKNKLKNL